MLRLFHINQSKVTILKQGRVIFTSLANASKSKIDFKSLVVPIEGKTPLQEIKVIAEERHGELTNDSTNEIFAMAQKHRKNQMRDRRQNKTTSNTIDEKRVQSYQEEDEEMVRDKFGRYVLKSELSKETKHSHKGKGKFDTAPHSESKKTSDNKKGSKELGKSAPGNATTDKKIESSQDKDDSGSYYNEFMKLVKKQKQPPYIFSPAQGPHHPEMDVYVRKLRRQLKYVLRDGKSFGGLGVHQHLLDILTSRKITTPTQVQIDAIPELLRGRNAIIEAATGSGKTLTFLLPLIQKLPQRPHPCTNLIIVPTRELATQIYNEVLSCGVDKKFVSRLISGVNEENDTSVSNVLKDSSILIGTPKKLLQIMIENSNHFRQVQKVVLDEIDKLLPLSYFIKSKKRTNMLKVKPTDKILALLHHFKRSTQLVATSATISNHLVSELRDLGFGNEAEVIKLIPDEYKHGRIPENIKHLFTAVPDIQDELSKVHLMARLFKHSKQKSVLVFIPGSESVDTYVERFKSTGLVARALYKELTLPSPGLYGTFISNFENGDIQVVVSTEETVRGIDLPFLSSIYLTFVPDSAKEYVHLAGRVGRLGQPAQVITLVDDSEESRDKKHLKRRMSLLGVKCRKLNVTF